MNLTLPPNTVQCSLRETQLMRDGRKHRARHKPKTLSYWLQMALALFWVYAMARAVLALLALPRVSEDSAELWNVIGCGMGLLMVTTAMFVLHFKLKKP
jgi:predicted nucleic acid-binding Zn ribbon protein